MLKDIFAQTSYRKISVEYINPQCVFHMFSPTVGIKPTNTLIKKE